MSSVASQLVRLVVDGYSPDWYAKWPSAVSAIDLSATAAGQAYTDPAGFCIIVAGDLGKIEESLGGLADLSVVLMHRGIPSLRLPLSRHL